jgi:hypothetical protein
MKSFFRRIRSGDLLIIFTLSLVRILLNLFINNQYDFHRDELYYLACGDHLDFGYVDHPPLLPWIASFIKPLIGQSLFAVRLIPTLAGGTIVALTGLSVKELGGGKFAQAVGCLAVIIAPLFLGMGLLFTTNVFDQLLSVLSIYLLILIFKKDNPRYWLLLGIVLGLGMMNKHTMLIFAAAILLSFALTPNRRYFTNKYFWVSVVIAIAIFSPNIYWQISHGWPTIEFLREAAINRMEQVSPLGFLAQQFFSLNPINMILLLAGLYYYLFTKDGKQYRVMGILFLLLFVFFAFQRSKDYYLAPAYPIIWAGGAILIEKLSFSRLRLLIRPILPVLMLIAGLVVLPFSIPILPVDKLEKLAAFEKTELPLTFRDMLGWENMTASLADVYKALPADQKTGCAILANNYGEAAAIDYYGSKYGLPKAICAHNSYWLWGPREYSGEFVLSVGLNHQDLQQGFAEVKKNREIPNSDATWYERDLSIIIWSKPKLPLNQMWPYIKMYY